MKLSIAVIVSQILGIHSLIVPDEIPTILSVIYSNIPILKKGTDSRLGWGFRLGDRADFQVLVELGPQTYTQPLANQEDKNTNNKRNAINSLSDTLYAQRQKEKQQSKGTEGGKWLETWSKNVQGWSKPSERELPPGAKPGIAIGEIDAKSVIPDDSVLGLTKLYEAPKKVTIDDKLGISADSVEKLTELYKVESTTSEESESVESTTVQGPE